MRRVRVLCEYGGRAVSLAAGKIVCNTRHDTARPTEKHAITPSIPSPDVGWGPVVMCSMLNRLRLIVGIEGVDSNIEAHIGQRNGAGHRGEAVDIRDIWLLLTQKGE